MIGGTEMSEFIKILESCIVGDCTNCSMRDNVHCRKLVLKDIMSTYDQQQEKITQLTIDLNKAKYEVAKEFAELIKLEFYREFDEMIPSIMTDKMDSFVKKYEEENNYEELY